MKKHIGHRNGMYPTPTTIIGAVVEGKPNFITIAHVGILNYGAGFKEHELLSFGIAKAHHTNQGIKEHQEFSVNIPHERQVAETDYCGIMSGRTTDKAALFSVSYGELAHAPLIDECPVSMECRLFDTYDLPNHDIFIGEVIRTTAAEDVLTDGALDPTKYKPLLFDMNRRKYFGVGAEIADCWRVGKTLKNDEQADE